MSPVDRSWWSAVVAVCGGYWWAVGGHSGWVCSTLVGCDAPWMLFAGASGGARSPLVGVGDGRSPPFVLPRCVFAFVVGRGWWWVLVLALALVRVAWLCAPVHRWWWVLTPARVASLGARVCCLRRMVVGAHARPRPHSCRLAARSRWWWVLGPVRVASLGACVRHWWMVAGAHPHLRPSLCAHPCSCGRLRVTVVACRHGCVCWWGLVRCVWDKRAYQSLNDE